MCIFLNVGCLFHYLYCLWHVINTNSTLACISSEVLQAIALVNSCHVFVGLGWVAGTELFVLDLVGSVFFTFKVPQENKMKIRQNRSFSGCLMKHGIPGKVCLFHFLKDLFVMSVAHRLEHSVILLFWTLQLNRLTKGNPQVQCNFICIWL